MPDGRAGRPALWEQVFAAALQLQQTTNRFVQPPAPPLPSGDAVPSRWDGPPMDRTHGRCEGCVELSATACVRCRRWTCGERGHCGCGREALPKAWWDSQLVMRLVTPLQQLFPITPQTNWVPVPSGVSPDELALWNRYQTAIEQAYRTVGTGLQSLVSVLQRLSAPLRSLVVPPFRDPRRPRIDHSEIETAYVMTVLLSHWFEAYLGAAADGRPLGELWPVPCPPANVMVPPGPFSTPTPSDEESEEEISERRAGSEDEEMRPVEEAARAEVEEDGEEAAADAAEEVDEEEAREDRDPEPEAVLVDSE